MRGAVASGRERPLHFKREPIDLKSLTNDDLIRERRPRVGEIERSLLRELFGVIRSRLSLENDRIIRTNDVEIADSSARLRLDVTFETLRQSIIDWRRGGITRIKNHLHAKLPVDRRGTRRDRPMIMVAKRERGRGVVAQFGRSKKMHSNGARSNKYSVQSTAGPPP